MIASAVLTVLGLGRVVPSKGGVPPGSLAASATPLPLLGSLPKGAPTYEPDTEAPVSGCHFVDRGFGAYGQWRALDVADPTPNDVRKLGKLPAGVAVYLEQVDEPDREIGDQDLVDLDGRGVEAFVGRKPSWKLNIQGVTIVSDTPTIVVSEAMIKEMFRILAPNGEMVISDPPPFRGVNPMQAVVLDWDTDNRAEPFFSAAAMANLAQMMRDAGFVDVEEYALEKRGYPWVTRGRKPA